MTSRGTPRGGLSSHSLDEALRWHDAVYQQLHEILDAPVSYSLSAENDEFEYE